MTVTHARETRDLSPKRGLRKMLTRNFQDRAREAKRKQGTVCRCFHSH